MSSKTKALLREELTVGGAIASVILLTGLFYILVQLIFSAMGSSHEYVADAILGMGVVVPLATAFLLVLNVANTGHLSGGFSRRILRLPVSTRTAVTVTLFTRLSLVLTNAAVLAALGWVCYGRGTGLRSMLIVAAVFLCIQVLDWSFAVAGKLAVGLGGGLLLAVIFMSDGLKPLFNFLASQASASFGATLIFVLFTGAAYGLSLLLVERARAGDVIAVGVQFPFTGRRILQRRRPFVSAFWAQVWFERGRAGLFFPGMFLAFWFLGIAIFVLTTLNHHTMPGEVKLRALQEPFWPFQMLPLLALLLAGVAWGIRMAIRKSASGRMEFGMRLPLRRDEMAAARLTADALTLGLWLGVIAVVTSAALLWADDKVFLMLFSQAAANGSINLSQILCIVLGPAFVTGLVAWACMTCGVRIRKEMLNFVLFIPGVFFLGVVFYFLKIEGLMGSGWSTLMAVLLVLFLAAPMGTFVYLLQLAWRRSLMTTYAACWCVGLWFAAAFALTPFSFLGSDRLISWYPFLTLGLAAILVLPYPALVLQFNRTQPGDAPAPENSAQFGRRRRGVAQYAVPPLLLAAVLGIGVVRWSGYPQWLSTMKAQGLPTTLAELDTYYAPVPDASNAALRYQEAYKLSRPLIKESQAPTRPLIKESHAPIVGDEQIGRLAPLTPESLRDAKEALEIYAPVAQALRDIAKSGLTQSRYPVDLNMGHAMQLGHLASLRDMARVLRFTAFMKAVDGDISGAVDDTLCILPIGDSLKEEPIVISQLVRFATVHIALDSVEDLLNRADLPEAELRRLQEGLTPVLLPEGESMTVKARVGESVVTLDYIRDFEMVFQYQEDISLFERLGASAMMIAVDVSGYMPGIFFVADCSRRENNDTLERMAQAMMDPVDLAYLVISPPLNKAEYSIRANMGITLAGLAVERFRLAKGRLPQKLDELVPEFISAIPADPFADSQPVSYRIKDNGEFVVYSYGWDNDDDRGEENLENKDNTIRDVTFTVPPPGRAAHAQPAPQGA